MKSRIRWAVLVLVLHLCWLAALTGCDDDQDRLDVTPFTLVRVTDEADGGPVADIKVVVMDPRHNNPVAGPFLSGADGMVNLGVLPGTDICLMVFGGVEYAVHSLPGYGTWNPAGSPSPSVPIFAPEAGGKSSADPVQIQMRKIPVDSLPRIAGKVVSAQDGSVLDQVFVSLSPYLTGYQLETAASDDVTGQDGAFSVSQIPFAKDPQTGNLIQINPLRFTRSGFRPLVWRYDVPNGSENVDISGVTIEMEPLEYFQGVITGLLLLDGLPAADVAVGLGVVDQAGDKAGPGMTGRAETTDEFGRFLFGQVPPGTYVIQPGFALGDGIFYTPQPGNPPITIVGRQVFNVGDVTVFHEIEPRDPAHGQVLATPPTVLSWTAVPGAATYEVRFDRGVLPPTTTNSIELPESLVISEGLHLWYVRALDKEGGLAGFSQIQSVFRYAP